MVNLKSLRTEESLKLILGSKLSKSGKKLVKYFQPSLKRLIMVINTSLLVIMIIFSMLKTIVDLPRVFLSMRETILWKSVKSIVQEKVSVEQVWIRSDNS